MGAYVPDEIVTDILVRLPPKFLGRCKCVSKHWNTLISDPQFIKTNFSLNLCRRKKFLCLDYRENSLAIVDVDAKPRVPFLKLKIRENHTWDRIFGSCNGLVLALDSEYMLFLLNPTTRVYKIVPKLQAIVPTLHWGTHKCPLLGLGYDSVTDDYKVVTFIYPQTVFVYSFKSGSWKRVQDCHYDPLPVFYIVWSRVSLNASIHWLHGDSMVSFITAFDLTAEKFREVPQPPGAINSLAIAFGTCLDVVGGCLCLINSVHYWDSGEIEIWVMKEYGVQESWTKFSVNYTLPVQPQEGFVGDHLEELVLMSKYWSDKAWFYDANKGKWRDVYIGVQGCRPNYGCKFADSLISP